MPNPKTASFGRTPLTDPRSLIGSLLFHGTLLLVASLAALSVALPADPELPQALRGELDPVDNRAPSESGGGSPGEIGGESVLQALPTAEGTSATGAPRDPAADALLSEILPSPATVDAMQQALPGPQTSGIGLVPGAGSGGGGGSGGGSGGGVGRGIGPGTEFFGAREHAGSFAYVIDCSGSMATRNALDVAKRELLASLGQLPPDARFAVIFYNLRSTTLADPQGHRGLMGATQGNKGRVRAQLAEIEPVGGTDHMIALRSALALRPEVIFFLTDADLMTNTDVTEILAEAGSTRIQAVEFGRGPELGTSGPLRRMATSTGGSYRYLDVTSFPKRRARGKSFRIDRRAVLPYDPGSRRLPIRTDALPAPGRFVLDSLDPILVVRGVLSMRIAIALAVASAAALGLWLHRETRHNRLVWDHFDEVKPGVLYRSGQLNADQLAEAVERHGIRTVVSFQIPGAGVEAERAVARRLKIDFMNLPMPGSGFGREAQFREVLKACDDPGRRPVLVHCARGTCRTGAAVALYRYERDGWTVADVAAEMKRQSYRDGWLAGYIYDMVKERPLQDLYWPSIAIDRNQPEPAEGQEVTDVH